MSITEGNIRFKVTRLGHTSCSVIERGSNLYIPVAYTHTRKRTFTLKYIMITTTTTTKLQINLDVVMHKSKESPLNIK